MFDWIRLVRRAVLNKRHAEDKEARRRAHERKEVAAFCAKVVAPTLQELQQEWERLGRKVSIYRDATIFHITVWNDRMVEFQYSLAACRRKRRRHLDYVHPEATTYTVDVHRVYELSEIRRTDRHKFANQIAALYRQSLQAR